MLYPERKTYMKQRITSVKDLPDWFKNKTYATNLNIIDWFREIRKRQKVLDLYEFGKKYRDSTGKNSEESRETLLSLLLATPRPDSLIYSVSQNNRPVYDLTASEALYFRSAIRDDDLLQLGKKYDELMSLWHKALDEMGTDDPTSFFGEYEHQIAIFFEKFDENSYAKKFDEPIEKFLEDIGNPYLSYGRPLNGSPITVDTQYDDETIITHFKNWLAEIRRNEGERIRRPFTQKDLDDWELYKIRQIFDLEMWASIMHVKINDKVIADSLWPYAPDNFSPIDVLRTTARKKIKDVFNFNVVVRLYGQLSLEFGENFLAQ